MDVKQHFNNITSSNFQEEGSRGTNPFNFALVLQGGCSDVADSAEHPPLGGVVKVISVKHGGLAGEALFKL